MTEESLACTRCQGEMESGYCPDLNYSVTSNPCWLPGLPKRGFFRGALKISATDWRSAIAVITFRCKNCGLLESYARPPRRAIEG